MKIILTYHSKKSMIDRGITLEEIKEIIELPDYTVSKDKMLVEAHKKIGQRNLKVVYIKSNKFIKIISVLLK